MTKEQVVKLIGKLIEVRHLPDDARVFVQDQEYFFDGEGFWKLIPHQDGDPERFSAEPNADQIRTAWDYLLYTELALYILRPQLESQLKDWDIV
jgi:hypothetical protein